MRASAAPFRSEAAHGRPQGKQEAPLWFRLCPHPGGVPDKPNRARSLFVFQGPSSKAPSHTAVPPSLQLPVGRQVPKGLSAVLRLRRPEVFLSHPPFPPASVFGPGGAEEPGRAAAGWFLGPELISSLTPLPRPVRSFRFYAPHSFIHVPCSEHRRTPAVLASTRRVPTAGHELC